MYFNTFFLKINHIIFEIIFGKDCLKLSMKKIFNKVLKVLKFLLVFIIKFASWTFFAFLIVGTFFGIYAFNEIRPYINDNINEAKTVIANSTYEDFLTNETTYIFNDNGKILKKLTLDQDSEYLTYEEIPEYVVNAFVAVEDRNFWYNKGINIKGITRVIYHYVISNGEEAHGASTITQQVARRTFLNFDKTLERKIKEIFYSFELEKKYTKEEIMEFYVNDIYYANQCYGISSASKYYFNKPVSALTLKQIAYLCSIPNSPSMYDPVKDKNAAIPRCEKILNDMLECGFISKEEYLNAMNEEIELDLSGNIIEFSNYQTTYAIKCAVEYFMKLDGFEFKYEYTDEADYKKYLNDYNEAYEKAYKELSSSGCMVYTSLNDEKQTILQTALDNEMSFNTVLTDDGIYSLQAAATLIDNDTRKVVAIVGGRTQDNLQKEEMVSEGTEDTEIFDEETDIIETTDNIYSLNRAFQSYRQPGSSIKPLIVYTPGLEKGYIPSSVIYSIGIKAANEKGADISKLTGTPYTYRRAVEKSDNGCAYYVYYNVGPRNGIQKIIDMNFHKIVPEDYYMSASLGGLTYGVTTEEMAGAYATLVNNGMYAQPTCITSIIDSDGNEIYVEDEEKQIYKEAATDAMLDILKGVITNGTAYGKVTWNKNIDICGKTGTTNDYKDGWFCGSSPYYSLAVWVGNDLPEPVEGLRGGTYPTHIWSDVMNQIHIGLDEKHFDDYELRDLVKGSDSYYSYLPGRNDDEVLSDGYTVADYRIDRVIGEGAIKAINNLSALSITSDVDIQKGQGYVSQAYSIVETVYSKNYQNELYGKLNNAIEIFNLNVSVYQQSIAPVNE